MHIITITIGDQDGRPQLGYFHSEGVTPAMAAAACRAIATEYDKLAIEAEVQRRLEEAQAKAAAEAAE